MKKVVVVPYDNTWIAEFEKIKKELLQVLIGHIISIEHVAVHRLKDLLQNQL